MACSIIRFLTRCLPLVAACAALVPLRAAPPAKASVLAQRVERILNSSQASRQAFWGIQAADASTGRVLYSLNAARLFAPASNTKLFTAALGLQRLGPDYRFSTLVMGPQEPDAAGRLAGDLRLVGGGDPSLATGPGQGLEALADQVAKRGLRRIDGDVIGDDTAYYWEPYPPGWEQDDLVTDYGAPASALTLNNNVVTLRLRAAGGLATVTSQPALEYYAVDNRVRAGPGLPNLVWLERMAGSRQVRLWGSLSSSPPAVMRRTIAVDNPALYAAAAFRDALERRGIVVAGRAAASHRFLNQPAAAAAGTRLAEWTSPPLAEMLRQMQKNSVNVYAELLLREVARARKAEPSLKGGVEERRLFLTEAGLAATDFRLADGSGLSDINLVTPAAVVKLLAYMYGLPNRPLWVSLLPVAAQDGTLADRFRGTGAAGRIRAKTGTLGHASALSGYAESRRGTVAFSILVNNYNCPAEQIRVLIDRVALALRP
jgi:D-alanyl-D-alanine carboxypeptidase/D-alanyl-D-alanine-endopeptidase (penicillin-binding protein 4)